MDERSIQVVIPAHSEGAGIAATLKSVAAQELPADNGLVVSGNCTDNTAFVAAEHGASVMLTKNNSGKKAGALNRPWRWSCRTWMTTSS